MQQLLNSNCFPNRAGLTPHWIILHGTAGGSSAQAIAQYFKSTEGTSNPVSAHYVIDQAGVIYQCNNEQDGAWANGFLSTGHDPWWSEAVNPNNVTISIEHCKASTDNSDLLAQAQQVASFALIQQICSRWSIPMRAADASGGITGHCSIDPVNRANCPGPYPWEQLWSFLEEGENAMLTLNDPIVSKYFTDGGNGTWKCIPNGVVLHDAILTFYASNGGPALFGLPLTGEMYPQQAPGTAMVPCERAMIIYDPSRTVDNPPTAGPCYLLHIDQGMGQALLAQSLVAPLHNQIASLQGQLTQAQAQTQPASTVLLQKYQALLNQINSLSKI